MKESVTLSQAMRESGLTGKELDYIRKRLVFVHTLAVVSSDAMDEIQFLLEKKGEWKYDIKHSCKEIARLCKKASNQGKFFSHLADKEIESFIERLEEIELALHKMFGVPETTEE